MTDQSGNLNLAFKAGNAVEGKTGRYDGSREGESVSASPSRE
jgi:hypothetical protein